MRMSKSNYSGYFLDPEKRSIGVTVVMARNPMDAKMQILKEAAAIYDCSEEEVILLIVQKGVTHSTFFNSQLEAGNV